MEREEINQNTNEQIAYKALYVLRCAEMFSETQDFEYMREIYRTIFIVGELMGMEREKTTQFLED